MAIFKQDKNKLKIFTMSVKSEGALPIAQINISGDILREDILVVASIKCVLGDLAGGCAM